MEHIFLKNILSGDQLQGIYFVKAAQQSTTQRGDVFWSLRISDCSGQMECKIWSPLAADIKEIPLQSFISVEGKTQNYKENVQGVIHQLRLLEDDEVQNLNLANYIPSSPRSEQEMLIELQELIEKHITYQPWKDFIGATLNDERVKPYFTTAPGAKSIHHAYLRGLFEHTLAVCNNCLAICALYPKLDKQILFAAALFHDIGKIEELSGALGTEYTSLGKLMGHISIGMEIVTPHLHNCGLEAHSIQHYKHLILSHHGELEYGSPKTPSTPEAFILHYADNIDAKLAQVYQALPDETLDNEDMAWTGWNNLLNRQLCRMKESPTHIEDPAPKQEQSGLSQGMLCVIPSSEPKQS